jgi:hypothetical protein
VAERPQRCRVGDVRPLARLDRQGLIRMLRGDQLVALSGDMATVETPTGARQTFRRRSRQAC